ncbi:hydroxylase [Rhodococcus sp. Leaf7]|uniref:SDR family oxidoreductase n=1 Tax=unclassified Rhodococcus (in: high G+C Gram-positive bacteria) TaxID=192944 RepID=UPI0006F30FB6|nr:MULTISPECIES: NAD(P)H-binding protein [unclassified Rhodococcus (in: high G+C Gram-positive bacteria)]KQU01941.1 hydroxylase [Rhodococcus sp. Leaf7]KQU38234.1 hydroxylase [Rhodococcus sp. Leaf247]
MTYIVHGATGAQGSPVLAALTAAGHSGTAAVRDTSSVEGPAVAVDYTSVDSLVDAYTGADGVFVHIPIGPLDVQMAAAHAVAEAVRRARPARVVFSTSGSTIDDSTPPTSAPEVLARELADSGVSHAVIEPRVFLENFLLPISLGPVRDDGVLMYPIRDDYAVSWSSHLDIADVAVRLLTDHTVTGVVSVGALPGLVGADVAAGFAAYLDRPVTFRAITPDHYGDLITPLFGAGAAGPVVESYHHRYTLPGEVITPDRSAQHLLGITPRTVQQWLTDLDV